MEKRRPTHELAAIQRQFGEPDGFRLTVSAQDSAFAPGLDREAVVALVRSIERKHFYKSMTSYRDHRLWQDVYRVEREGGRLYVKFAKQPGELFALISSKEV